MLNTAIIMGRLTADPELRTTNTGIAVTTFTVAVDRRYQKAGEEKQTDFINVVAWRQTAEFVSRYFQKGSMIAVRGSIQTRRYEDNNGNKRTAVEIVADEVSFCGSKAETGTGSRQVMEQPARTQPAASFATGSADDFEEIPVSDDLPF
ncbi:MAG: single-stranded DNA-binding protein [Clostridia bacterium]|nr:single-stranded DNA-binding protein [Oscillospiraceae bacterium]MDD6219701.1 single-stranded DNA-binding protein [Clostridia bacterium]